MSDVAGFALAVLIGLTLGMLGAGGSILTVPVLVHVMGFEPKSAIAMSLPVVGAASLVGAAGHWRSGNLEWRAIATFAPLAMLGAVVGARLASRVSGTFQLTLLAGVMTAAGLLMLRNRDASAGHGASATSAGGRVALGITGCAVGLLTGLVGVGGGFIIVPALVLLARVPMKRAVGTSLVVITLSTVTALAAYGDAATISWRVVGLFALLTIAGAVVGTRLVRHVPAAALRRAFAVVVLALAALLLYENRAAGVPSGTPAARLH
jgi:uncharacterized membrane protein YfcA